MATVTFDERQIDLLCDDLAGLYRVGPGEELRRVMQRECPVDTGTMRDRHVKDVIVRVAPRNYRLRFRARVPYSVFVHEGHGPIVPVRARALRWVNKAGVVVFARRVRAVAANPWMYRAMVLSGLPAVRTFR